MVIRRGITVGIILSSLFLIANGCVKKERKATIGNPAPEFTLTDLTGKKVRLSDYSEKVVLIDFWATWCPPCKESIPFLESLYQRYKERGFVVIGISLDEETEIVERFKKRFKITYPILMGEEKTKKDYRITGLPEMFILERNGNLRYHHLGFNKSLKDKIDKEIKGLL